MSHYLYAILIVKAILNSFLALIRQKSNRQSILFSIVKMFANFIFLITQPYRGCRPMVAIMCLQENFIYFS